MKTRIIWTKVFKDEWFVTLSAEARELFFFLAFGEDIGFTGIFEISDRTILFNLPFLKNSEARLEKLKKELFPKVIFYQGWVKVVNSDRYNTFRGEKIGRAITKELDQIPENIKSALVSINEDRVSMGYPYTMDTLILSHNHIPNNIYINKDIEKSEVAVVEEPLDELGKVKKMYPDLFTFSEADFQEIAVKYRVTPAFVASKYDDLLNWVAEMPKRGKDRNFRRTLMNWVKRDSLKIKTDYAKQDKYRGIDASGV